MPRFIPFITIQFNNLTHNETADQVNGLISCPSNAMCKLRVLKCTHAHMYKIITSLVRTSLIFIYITNVFISLSKRKMNIEYWNIFFRCRVQTKRMHSFIKKKIYKKKKNECTVGISCWKDGYIHVAWEEGIDVNEMPTGSTLNMWEHTLRVDLHVSHDL